jgi:hypothetical protein
MERIMSVGGEDLGNESTIRPWAGCSRHFAKAQIQGYLGLDESTEAACVADNVRQLETIAWLLRR